jgi:hypothetical protein
MGILILIIYGDRTWVVLRTHNNDLSLNGAYATATWPLVGDRESYRFFRLISTGADSSGYHNLMCAGIELYGNLTERLV